MTTAHAAQAPAPTPPGSKFPIPIGLLAALAALLLVLALPTPEGLSTAGHRMLAVLLFAVVVWVSESVSYEVSCIGIVALIALLVGFSPQVKLDAAKAFIAQDPPAEQR